MLSCVISPPQIYRYYSTLSYIPIILCLVLLSLWYPALLIRSFTSQEETLEKEVMKICGVVAWENPRWTCMVLGALLGTGRTGVLPGHVFPTRHRELPLLAQVTTLFILLDLKRE